MKDIQAHLDKIRSDAAECILLSSLVPDGKREVFAKTAEHLNALALEIEKTLAANSADMTHAGNRDEAIAADIAAAHHQHAARPRRMLPWILAIVFGGIVGTSFWAINPAREYWPLSALPSKHATSPATQDETKQAIVTLLSGEQGERKLLMEQLGALAARVDNLARTLDDLKTAHVEIGGSSNKEFLSEKEKPAAAETKPPATEERPHGEENRTSTPESLAAARQPDGARPATDSPLIEPVDRVGAIPRRAELDPRKPTIGPAGCTHFRSFDAASGTYVTLDGRRRPCQ